MYFLPKRLRELTENNLSILFALLPVFYVAVTGVLADTGLKPVSAKQLLPCLEDEQKFCAIYIG